MLVSHSVICFAYFIPINHGVNKKVPPVVFPHSSPYTKLLPGLFVVLQETLYQPLIALIRLMTKIMHFQSKTNFFFQRTAGRFGFCYVMRMCFLGRLLYFSFHKTTISFIFPYMNSFLFGLSSNLVP